MIYTVKDPPDKARISKNRHEGIMYVVEDMIYAPQDTVYAVEDGIY